VWPWASWDGFPLSENGVFQALFNYLVITAVLDSCLGAKEVARLRDGLRTFLAEFLICYLSVGMAQLATHFAANISISAFL
jgi:hypothetical protein